MEERFVSMEQVFDLENENYQLIERIAEIEAENHRLCEEKSALLKELEKQKTFHRKFSDDVIESERVRNEDFKSEKRSLIEENKALIKENRQLVKDVSFYKKAYEELLNAKDLDNTKNLNQRPAKVEAKLDIERTKVKPVYTPRASQRRATTSTSPTTSTSLLVSTSTRNQLEECTQKSSTEFVKISEKLLIENKKLKLKNDKQSTTIQLLRKQNRQLETFKDKMTKKKLKFSHEADELGALIESTKLKNKNVFTPEILCKLAEFSQ